MTSKAARTTPSNATRRLLRVEAWRVAESSTHPGMTPRRGKPHLNLANHPIHGRYPHQMSASISSKSFASRRANESLFAPLALRPPISPRKKLKFTRNARRNHETRFPSRISNQHFSIPRLHPSLASSYVASKGQSCHPPFSTPIPLSWFTNSRFVVQLLAATENETNERTTPQTAEETTRHDTTRRTHHAARRRRR
jgi:hypothetical protein